MNASPVVVRDEVLLEDLVLVDGQGGCGKTLVTSIVAALERVELLNYSPEIENVCSLYYLGKIDDDAAQAMIRIQADLVLYETMMSRGTNFRPGDLSSVFRDVDFLTYIKRLFLKGDEAIPARIKQERPILLFATHNLLAYSEPIHKALGKKVAFIEIVRHPLYMLIQQTLNQINHFESPGTARQFNVFIKHKDKQLPYLNFGQEELFLSSSPVESAIYEMQNVSALTELFKERSSGIYGRQVLTIPFERFVLEPWPYIEKMEGILSTKMTSKTRKVMSKQKVPRAKISDGIPLDIYKRCGWEPPEKKLSEEQELDKRRQFAIQHGAGNEAMEALDRMCDDYEEKYLSNISEFKRNSI